MTQTRAIKLNAANVQEARFIIEERLDELSKLATDHGETDLAVQLQTLALLVAQRNAAAVRA